jgi:hypothetical protein
VKDKELQFLLLDAAAYLLKKTEISEEDYDNNIAHAVDILMVVQNL